MGIDCSFVSNSGLWTILQDAKLTRSLLPCLRNPGYFFHPRRTFWWVNEDTGQMSPLPFPIWHPVWHLLHVCRSSSKSIHVSFRTRSGANSELLMCQTTLKQSRNCEGPFKSLEDFFSTHLHQIWGHFSSLLLRFGTWKVRPTPMNILDEDSRTSAPYRVSSLL